MELLGICLVCGLATWRFASLLHTEDAFEWLRKWIGIQNDDEGYPAVYPDGFWGDVFNCFWCLSLFAGALLSTVSVLAARLDAVWILLVWLGSSAFAIYWEKQIMRTQSR